MPTQLFFSNWPVWVRGIAAAACLGTFVAVLSLIGGCGQVSLLTPVEPDFYISHLQDPNAVWLKSGANNPAPLTIALPLGTSVNDLAALEYNGPSDWLYLVSSNAAALVIVNQVGSTYQVAASVPVGANPHCLAIDGSASFAYVSNANDSVTVVDLSANQPVSTIALPAGSQPYGIAVTPDGKTVYVANQSTGTLSVIDAIARSVTGSIAVGNHPMRVAMSPNGSVLYVSNSGDGTVSVIDVLSNSVSATLSGFTNTLAVGVNGAGTNLFVGQAPALPGAGSVAIYNTSTLTASTTPAGTTSDPVFVLGIGPASFLSADQFTSKVTEQWVTTGNPTLNQVWTVGVAPSAIAVLRQVNRSPNLPQNVTDTVTTIPANLQVTLDGGPPVIAPQTVSWVAGTSHTLGAPTPQLDAGGDTQYILSATTPWTATVGTITSTGSVASAPATSSTFTASFNTAYQVTLVLNGCMLDQTNVTGLAAGSPAFVPAGSLVNVTVSATLPNLLQSIVAVPSTNATIASNGVTIVPLTGPVTITATCAPPQNVTLTVATNPTGLLALIGTSGAYAPAPISQQVAANQTETISVTTPQYLTAALTGYGFSGWSTGGSTPTTTVQPSANFTATANFTAACYALTVDVQPASSGTVTANPPSGGLSGLPANCYAPGTTVTLTATGAAAQNYIFSTWSGAGTGYTTRTVVMNGPATVTANFSLYPAPEITFGGAHWGYTSGSAFQIVGYIGNNGANYNNIMVTQVVWAAGTGTGTITNTTALPIVIGNLAGGTVSANITLTSTMPTTVTGFTVCTSGTAVSPLSGSTVAWTDNQNCGHVFPIN